MEKKSVPNINHKTGISCNYRLAYGNLRNYLEKVEEEGPRTRFLARNTLLRTPIKKYEEFFIEEEYVGVVTDENKESVKSINSLVNQINDIREKMKKYKPSSNRSKLEYGELAPLRDLLDSLVLRK